MSHSRRLANLERAFAVQLAGSEISIIGGLPDSEHAPFATLLPSGAQVTARSRETRAGFELRARQAAKKARAEFLVFGGFPAEAAP